MTLEAVNIGPYLGIPFLYKSWTFSKLLKGVNTFKFKIITPRAEGDSKSREQFSLF